MKRNTWDITVGKLTLPAATYGAFERVAFKHIHIFVQYNYVGRKQQQHIYSFYSPGRIQFQFVTLYKNYYFIPILLGSDED